MINVFSMADTEDFNQYDVRENIVDNAVGSFSDSVCVMRADELFYTCGSRVFGKSFNSLDDTAYGIGRKFAEFFYR